MIWMIKAAAVFIDLVFIVKLWVNGYSGKCTQIGVRNNQILEVFAGLLRSDAAAAGVTVTILMLGF